MRLRLAFALAILLCLIGVWIEIPAPTYWFLTLTVGAPELSPWLLLLALIPLGIAAVDHRRRSTLARLTIAVAIAAMILPARVLVRIPTTIHTFDNALTSALGGNYLARVPADILSRMHSTPVHIGRLFTGLGTSDAQIRRGVIYATPGGDPLTLDIYRPPLDRPAPIIVQMYGGRWQRGEPDDDGEMAASLASRGYVVLAIDYRHAPKWTWPAQLDDVRAAMQWARVHASEFGGDATRIATLGRSSGAQLAIIAGITAGTADIRAIVLYYSPVDLTDGYRNPGSPDTLHLRDVEEAFLGGTPDTIPDVYRSASPIEYARRPHPPVLLIDGGHDHIVKFSYGQVLADALRSSGTCAFMIIPWADHAFDAVPFGPSAQLASYYTERFLAWAMWSR